MRTHAAAPAALLAPVLRLPAVLLARVIRLAQVIRLAAVALLAASTACSPPATPLPPSAAAPPWESADVAPDVLTALETSPRFRTFARLATAAGLEPNLRGEGEWTVLAPTDDAFERLPAGTVDGLLRPDGKDALVALVRHHLVEGRVTSEELRKRPDLETVHGGFVSLRTEAGQLRVEGARVVLVDLQAANGVVHGIETVLVPRAAEPD